jgi:HAE1 family hydrophobic/amphiphilic exporter-1
MGEPALEATLNSAREISFTILSMTLSLAAVFLPLVFMPGLVGRIFREFAITIIVSIFASGLVSLTLTPLMCARLLGVRGHHGKKTLMERFAGAVIDPIIALYGSSLTWFLRHKWISAITWFVCLAGTILLLFAVPKSFLPVGDSSFIFGFMIGQQGSSYKQMRVYQDRADAIMQADPTVDVTFSMTGNTQFLQSNQGILLAFLKEPSERPPLVTPTGEMPHPPIANVAGNLMGKLSVIPAFAVMNPQPVLQISTGATSNLQGEYAYALSGIDPQETYEVSRKLVEEMRKYEGFAQPILTDLYDSTPNLEIEILREQASSYGVSVSKIEALLRKGYSQNYLYLIKKPEDQYQVIMEVADKSRSNPDDLRELYVRSDDGQRVVPLSAVTRWKQTTGPQSVNHINQFTSVTIFFNLKPGYAIGAATEFLNQATARIVPPQIRGTLQGKAKDFEDTIRNMISLGILAIFIMYVILGILYESYVHPITVLTSLPVALVGGLATLYLFHEEASLYAFIGMFMLMGIVKKNGIMMIDFALQRMAEGRTSVEAIHDASVDRFRPIIMTTLAALMGAIPIALGFGADGASRRPLGLIIVGGLLVSQLITLYVTPVLYLYMEAFQMHVLDRIPFFRSHHHGHAVPSHPVAGIPGTSGTHGTPHASHSKPVETVIGKNYE